MPGPEVYYKTESSILGHDRLVKAREFFQKIKNYIPVFESKTILTACILPSAIYLAREKISVSNFIQIVNNGPESREVHQDATFAIAAIKSTFEESWPIVLIADINGNVQEEINLFDGVNEDSLPEEIGYLTVRDDGKRIAFIGEKNGNKDIYTLDFAGNLKNITNSPAVQEVYTKYSTIHTDNIFYRRYALEDGDEGADTFHIISDSGKYEGLIINFSGKEIDTTNNGYLYTNTEGRILWYDTTTAWIFELGSGADPEWSCEGGCVIYTNLGNIYQKDHLPNGEVTLLTQGSAFAPPPEDADDKVLGVVEKEGDLYLLDNYGEVHKLTNSRPSEGIYYSNPEFVANLSLDETFLLKMYLPLVESP